MLGRRQTVFGLAALPLGIALVGCSDRRRASEPLAIDPDSEQVQPLTSIEKANLVELFDGATGLRLDLRYATNNNFTGEVLYAQARAFLVGAAAQALGTAIAAARQEGFGLTIFDAYRPWQVTKQLWDATPPAKREFVANPRTGSRHNRGCAIDCSLHDLKSGTLVAMPSGYDEFSERAYRNYAGGTAEETENRARLERYMTDAGFIGIPNEWWHFDFKDWASYPVLDVPFEAI